MNRNQESRTDTTNWEYVHDFIHIIVHEWYMFHFMIYDNST